MSQMSHEEFVHGNGTSVLDVSYRILIIPLSILFHRSLVISFLGQQSKQLVVPEMNLTRILLDFLGFIFPIFLSLVLFTNRNTLSLFYLFLLGFSLSLSFSHRSIFRFKWQSETEKRMNEQRKPFLAEYRVALLVLTIISILAIDFPLFPRSFGKTQTYGFSLMDAGVGFFQISAALTSKQARSATTQPKQIISLSHNIQQAMNTLRSNTIIIAIGLARIFAVKATDYHEVVSEYGTHWNFFFTLCFTQVLVAVLNVPASLSGLLGILLIGIYQILLSFFGVSLFLQDSPRDNLFTANREGICSLLGYTALYLLGIFLGNRLFSYKTEKDWKKALIQTFFLFVIFYGVAHFSDLLIEENSRRFANAAYIFSIFSLSCLMIFFLIGINMFTIPVNNLFIEAINFNSLFFFFFGNILTGLTNLTLPTHTIEDVLAFGILLVYCLAVVLPTLFLYKYKVALKI